MAIVRHMGTHRETLRTLRNRNIALIVVSGLLALSAVVNVYLAGVSL
jgi:siroheme synthase